MNLILYITNECNLNCSYCFVNKTKEVMNMQSYKKIFEEYKEKIDTVTFFGGEPLLQFELIKKIIEYNEQNKYIYNYIINTNGIKINDDLINLSKEKNIFLNISLDGTLKSNQMNRCKKEVYKLIENHIEMVKNKGIHFAINYVITPNNIKYINESLQFFAKKGIVDICLLINYDAVWTKKNIEQLKEQLEKSIPLMLKAENSGEIKIYPLYNKINYILTGTKEMKCNFGKDNIVVSCDGKKYPCISFTGDNHYEITEKDQIFANVCDVKKCQNCEYLDICNNNCMCRFCYHNKKSEIDVNCECEKIFIQIAEKIVKKLIDHE